MADVILSGSRCSVSFSKGGVQTPPVIATDVQVAVRVQNIPVEPIGVPYVLEYVPVGYMVDVSIGMVYVQKKDLPAMGIAPPFHADSASATEFEFFPDISIIIHGINMPSPNRILTVEGGRLVSYTMTIQARGIAIQNAAYQAKLIRFEP